MMLGLLLACVGTVLAMSVGEKNHYRDEVKAMFYHSYNSYMDHAYPWDELKPLSCEGRRWDRRERGTLDDSLGGFSLTLVDTLDMLVVLDDYKEFKAATQRVLRDVSFDRNITVSVFETTIRVLGGLLSAHNLVTELEWGEPPLSFVGSLSNAPLPTHFISKEMVGMTTAY
jgi:hypothetical protein